MNIEALTDRDWTLKKFVRLAYERRIQRQFDALVPIIADEGMGKSTLMVQATALWQWQQGQDPTVESVLDQLLWGEREVFKNALATYPERSAVPVMDAARALYKRDAMQGDQKTAEKDLLDVRTRELFMMLGYQDYDDIPSSLAKRRATAAIRIPSRGTLEFYFRDELDERWSTGDWPDPVVCGSFPDLEGTELWDAFKKLDKKKKQERILGEDDNPEPEAEADPHAVVEEIKTEGIERVVSIHGGHNKAYIDPDLIQIDYGLSVRKARTVKKLLDRDPDVDLEPYQPAD